MKKLFGLVLIVSVLIAFSSCSSVQDTGRLGMYPMRDIPVVSIEDLQSGSFEILGVVKGEGCVSIDDPNDGNTYGYGSFEVMEVDRMYFSSDAFVISDPYFISQANAINAMIKEARALDATFVTFPSYTIDLVDGNIVTVVTATAVKLVNAPEAVVINNSYPEGTYNVSLNV